MQEDDGRGGIWSVAEITAGSAQRRPVRHWVEWPFSDLECRVGVKQVQGPIRKGLASRVSWDHMGCDDRDSAAI